MTKVFIFTHIPKTAGTTLRYHFQKHLEDQQTFIHFANKGDKQAKALGLKPFKERNLVERMGAKVILGHNVDKYTKLLIGSNTPYELIFFRDPMKWEISRYNQYANSRNIRGQSFFTYLDWYQKEKIHCQFDWFLTSYCKLANNFSSLDIKYNTVVEQLKPFNHVGFVDNIDSDLTNIFSLLGIPSKMNPENITGRFRKVDFFNQDKNNYQQLETVLTQEVELFSKIRKKFDR